MEVLRRDPRQRYGLILFSSLNDMSYTVINMSSNVTHTHPPTIIGVQNSSSPSVPYHALFVFLIPLLVRVIDINNVQEKNKSLIETHPMNMCPFLLALLIYVLAHFAAIISKRQIFKAAAVISGSLCSVSLVSIILPHPYGHFSFIIWTFLLLLVAYHKRLHKKIWEIWNRFGGNNQQLLSM